MNRSEKQFSLYHHWRQCSISKLKSSFWKNYITTTYPLELTKFSRYVLLTSLNRKVMIWCGFFRLTIAPFTTLDNTRNMREEKFEIVQCATRLYRWWGRFDHLTESMRLWLCWISHHFPWLNWTTRRELNDRFRCCEVKLKLVAFCVWVRSFGTASTQC